MSASVTFLLRLRFVVHRLEFYKDKCDKHLACDWLTARGHKWINNGGGEKMTERVKTRQILNRRLKRKQNFPISSTKKSLTTKRFIRFVPSLTTMLINNKGTKLCSRFRFSALFFNLEAFLQIAYTRARQVKLSALYQSEYNSCQKIRTHFSSLDI
jgi:hypothetical protein